MKTLLKQLSYMLLAAIMVATASLQACTPEGPDGSEEQNLIVNIEPTPTNPMVRTLGPTYDFGVVVRSRMPRQGVTVNVEYRRDSDQSVLFSQAYNATSSPINVTVMGIPFNEVGTVTVTVTSNTKPSNRVTQTFKLVRK